jgi:hypothetical protein
MAIERAGFCGFARVDMSAGDNRFGGKQRMRHGSTWQR